MFNAHTDKTIRPDSSEIGEPQSARSVLKDKRGLSTSLPEALGALGLGILVLTGIGVGIGAAYNYGQDSSAKQTLDAVKSAQVLYQAKTGSFGTMANLTTGTDPALTAPSASVAITNTATNYCAVIKSRSMSGPTYWMTSKSGKVLEAAPTDAGVTCPTPPAG